jgi:GT2 family glycosyltransferase
MKDNIIVVFSSNATDEDNDLLKKHISDGIGVKHKVVCYTNFNEYSLSEVYNRAIDEHNNDKAIMVFCHNDIHIKTKNWGKILLHRFNNWDYDIIGVAGSKYLPESGMWWEDRTKMVGAVEHTDGIKSWISQYSRSIKGHIEPVVLIDGLFMAVDCNNIIHKWDEDFKGFHFYDLSFCVPNYLDGCDIGVITDIEIRHNSVGMTNETWENNRKQFAEKYGNELPLSILPIVDYIDVNLEKSPKVTVIIPTKNNLKYIINNIYSWKNNVEYDNYEIIIADTGSNQEVIDAYSPILGDNVRLVKYDYYNFARINNDVVRNYVTDDTELILFCNDDIKLLNDALSQCIQVYNENKETVGSIGIRLHFGNGNIQHNGILFISFKGIISFLHKEEDKSEKYRTTGTYSSVGNTGAFLMINKDLFWEQGGFNENYIECFEDVELNLKCVIAGRENLTISDAVAYHYTSVSRDKDGEKMRRVKIDYEDRLHPFYIKNKEKLDEYLIVKK